MPASSALHGIPTVGVCVACATPPVDIPASLEKVAELKLTNEGHWGFEETEVMHGRIAAIATRRFSIMKPYVDEGGAERIVSFFQPTRPVVARELVVRFELPVALASKASELISLGFSVYVFRNPRQEPKN